MELAPAFGTYSGVVPVEETAEQSSFGSSLAAYVVSAYAQNEAGFGEFCFYTAGKYRSPFRGYVYGYTTELYSVYVGYSDVGRTQQWYLFAAAILWTQVDDMSLYVFVTYGLNSV